MTDPFNIVKDELKRSVNKTRSLIESYNALANNKFKNENDETSNKLLSDIRTNLKSINWDIQDLEETITIASKNPSKFNLTNSDIENRRQFISQTKEFVQKTKQSFNIELDESGMTNKTNQSSTLTTKSNSMSNFNTANINIRIPDLISNTTNKNNDYVRLNENDDSDYESNNRKNFQANNSSNSFSQNRSTGQNVSLQMQHEDIFKEQDKNLDLISGRVSSLKNISQTMQNELDDQAKLLDDLGREMDTTDSKMQLVMKKITKVLHMSTDRRQWTLIFILLAAIVVVLILFAILPACI